MSSGIPVYNHACLATDRASTAPSFYLIGSASPGSLEVNYINNPYATTYTPIANQIDLTSWTPNAAKLCFIHPFAGSVNPGIKIVQFGLGSTSLAIAQRNNISDASEFPGWAFLSPKLFSWSGSVQNYDMFTVVTNEKNLITSSPGGWGSLRMSFRESEAGLLSHDFDRDPVVVGNAMLMVGTYEDASTGSNTTRGHTIVFDKNGRGQIFTATGNLLSTKNNKISALVLGIPESVNMNGISLTENAIPITMGDTAYILDKATNGSTAIYSINPTTSTALNRVYNTGDCLPFTNNMVAGALNNKLLTYSVNKNVASFNVFDVTTSSWSGTGVVSASSPVPTTDPSSASSPTSMGAIIAGAVGGLFLVASAVLFFVRHRRRHHLHQSQQESKDDTDYPHLQGPDTNMYDGGAGQQGYVQYDIQGYIQYEQGYVPYDPQGHQHPSPTFIPPPPLNNGGADESYKVPQPISTEPPSSSFGSPLTRDTSYISPTSYRESPSITAPKCLESVLTIASSSPDGERSLLGQNPQYVPGGVMGAVGSEIRSPQMVPSIYLGH